MKCPCNECIKYPICINESHIFCNDYYYYADLVRTKVNIYFDYDGYWRKLRNTLKNVQYIVKENDDYGLPIKR